MYSTLAVLSGLALAAAQTTTTTTTLVPDQPVKFFAQLYNTTSDCSGNANYGYLESMGNCVDITVSGSGSANMVIGETDVYFLAAYTGLGCTGDVILVEASPNSCTALDGTEAQSWSNDQSVFGKK
ncbi:hypothetical protein VP1G_07494 [Cytospora mali]|uniref:Uncharacterized protein n=1 Tax=Cytospora mali TaxID=578113 RepID=A0A194V8X7_CYTMA|nr:hypothetical protein VP1G_07494 [Valsa mali var. pyri (nom. inval.)]